MPYTEKATPQGFRIIESTPDPLPSGTVEERLSSNFLLADSLLTEVQLVAQAAGLAVDRVEAANHVFAGPVTGTDAAPTFRALAAADLPAPATEAKNLVYAGPVTGSDAAPTFRALAAADLPAPATEAKNLVYAGPVTGTDAAPTFRALAAADLPAAILPASSGAPSDTPALGTVRFNPATGILYVYGSLGWVFMTLTSGS